MKIGNDDQKKVLKLNKKVLRIFLNKVRYDLL